MSLVRAVTIVLLLALALPVLAIKLPSADTPGQAAAVSAPSPVLTPAAVISPAKSMTSVAVAATAPAINSPPAPPVAAPPSQPPRQSFAPPWGTTSVAFGPPSLPPPQGPAPRPDTQSRRQPPPSPQPSLREAGRSSSFDRGKEPSSRPANGPAPREYHTPPAPYRYGPRVDHRTGEQRQASRSVSTPDSAGDRKSTNQYGGRSQLSEQKRQALIREYTTTMRRQAEIERELTASLPGRPASKRDRYSDASGR